jgi:hypothetical protein
MRVEARFRVYSRLSPSRKGPFAETRSDRAEEKACIESEQKNELLVLNSALLSA